MKVALCLSGTLGGVKGKAGEKSGGAERVLNLAYPHFKQHILDVNDVDVFIHSWDTELEDEIRELYKPKVSVFEEQKIFEIPSHLENTQRVQNHFSRWYSVRQAVWFQKFFGEQFDTSYDFVMVTRPDLAWKVDVDFSQFDPRKFYVANWFQHHTSEPMGFPNGQYNRSLQDCWFFGNKYDMDAFAEIYHEIPRYTKDNKELSGYKGISNHRLAYHKLKTLDILPHDLEFAYRYDVPAKNDFPLVRWHYFNEEL